MLHIWDKFGYNKTKSLLDGFKGSNELSKTTTGQEILVILVKIQNTTIVCYLLITILGPKTYILNGKFFNKNFYISGVLIGTLNILKYIFIIT
jgi:hypothetical protein